VLAMAVLSSCTGQPVSGGPEPAPPSVSRSAAPTYSRYVALGDSFTAAPYVPTTDLAKGCLRSNGNYPSLVADRLDVTELVDVSCAAATTRDLRRPQRTYRTTTVPPQLDALTPDTDLVTLGIGGNDFELFGTLLRTCTTQRSAVPESSPCTDVFARRGLGLQARLDRIGGRVERALTEILRRAPQARVALVGYPRFAPTTGTCPLRFPLAESDYRTADRIARTLRDQMRQAAEDAGVGFVDMYRASRGHDVCSEEPWVNGQTTDQAAALAYHPFPAGMDAVADRLVARLS